MIPKEKAKELVDKFLPPIVEWRTIGKFEVAQQCALICVEEMLDCNTTSVYFEEDFEYWKEVKQELLKQ